MKLILENTDRVVEVNGVPARVWEGKTESGIPCFALITRVGVHESHDCEQFTKELQETKPPTFSAQATSLRMFLD